MCTATHLKPRSSVSSRQSNHCSKAFIEALEVQFLQFSVEVLIIEMNLVSGYKGVVGLVFGNENSSSNEDSYVERLLDRINNGTKTEDRRTALTELQSVVSESNAAQLAFGAMGFPVLLSVLKEGRDDLEMVRGALETLLGALTPLNHAKGIKNEVQPATLNADLLSREGDSISLLLSLLEEEDFYVRYYALQLLTVLLTNSPSRLQEVILATPRGITRLMDMLMDREVIRNEALLLLTYLTREAEEIQKIVVFEGAFEKIFSIIKEEGGSDGGVVVQDCLELLKNILHKNASNQTLLRETMGFDPVISLLRFRGSAFRFSGQKTVNLVSAIKTVSLLIGDNPETEFEKDANSITNKTVLVQKKILDHLLLLGVESHWAPVPVHSAALQCIGDLIAGHPKNKDILASKVLGDEPQVERALNSILRIILRSSSMQEFVAADYVIRCFCEKNPDGQVMLVSTMTPQQPLLTNSDLLIENVSMTFGSMLLRGLTVSENDGNLEICSRAASVFSYILKDNNRCKEQALEINLEVPLQSIGAPEPLMHHLVRCLALASSMTKDKTSDGKGSLFVQPLILKLLVTWLVDSPSSVQCFLDARPHLTFLIELLSSQAVSACVRGLAAVLLGESVIYNKSVENSNDAFFVVDTLSQKVGLVSYFEKFNEMMKSSLFSSKRPMDLHKPLKRSSAADLEDVEDAVENVMADQQNGDHPILASLFDASFADLVNNLEIKIREQIVEAYSHPKSMVASVPAELEQKTGETDAEYIQRLKSFLQKQCSEIQDLLRRNASLAEQLAKKDRMPEQSTGRASERVQVEALKRELKEASERQAMLRAEKEKIESEAAMYKTLTGKMESDLKSLSDAYNSIEQANFHLEKEVKALRSSGVTPYPDVEAIRAEVREEALKESEVELNDLLVCLGQEQSKVEKLSARLLELREDVDELLEGIADDTALPEVDEEDEH
ncbi:Golgin putative 6-like protein [Drosera capensis]